MPLYRVDDVTLNIPEDAVLVDTGVLVEAFSLDGREGFQYAEFVFEEIRKEISGPLFIPSAVVVESWGMIAGSRGSRSAAINLLTWLNSPGRATLVPHHRPEMHSTQLLIQRLYLDCVDAIIAELATDITQRCDLRLPITVATTDIRDFSKFLDDPTIRMRVYDIRNEEFLEF